MRHGDFPGMRPIAAPHQAGVADGVMRRTEGTRANHHLGREGIRHRVNTGDFQGFLER